VSKPILVVATRLVDTVEERIDREYETRRNLSPASREQLLALADGADAMLVAPPDRLDAEFFQRVSPQVRIIATYSVGLDHIDLKAAAARNIPIAYTPGVNSDATANIAMLLMLGASRRVYEAQSLVRTGLWASTNSSTLLGWELTDKILGIVGMGRVGQVMARRASAFGMKIHYTSRRELAADQAGDAVFHENVRELLQVSQFLSLHAPETAETRHLLNSKTLALLPWGAIVVNTARGGLVADDDLIAALKSGHVAAAGLDVYEGEPNIHPGYLDLKNVFLLPHIGSATVETRTRMGMLALDNIDAVLHGRPAPSLVSGSSQI
jgi:lactate dehydrogenase-like 2-hydroxyacid dehydrogenase